LSAKRQNDVLLGARNASGPFGRAAYQCTPKSTAACQA